MIPKSIFLLLGCILLMACQTPSQPLTLSPLFSNHMVFQQQDEVAIWGSYSPEGNIKVKASWGAEAEAKASTDGNWQVALATPEAGGPFELEISTADSSIIIRDVMLGEVWLASGQSNMEMTLSGFMPTDPIQNSAQEIAESDHPGIRMFTVQRNFNTQAQDTLTGEWLVSNPSNAAGFSATAYFFARRLHQELNVPVGIILSSWGGTPVEAWISKTKLKGLDEFDQAIRVLENPETIRELNAWLAICTKVELPQTQEQWDQLSLGDEAVMEADYADEDWISMTLPGRFDLFESGDLDGAIWLRKTIQLEEAEGEYYLEMGAVDDMDATYINGQKVGGLSGAGQYNVPRRYVIPQGLLKKGKNTLAIRAIDTGGPGEIRTLAQLVDEAGKTISLEGDWKVRPVAEIYQNAFYAYDIQNPRLDERPDFQRFDHRSPTVLHNAMIHPLLPYTVNGAIWYQGEDNVGRAEQYQELFPLMIRDWREQWQRDFPFYFVQIAPYRYNQTGDRNLDQSQKLRDAQRLSLSSPKTGMAVTLDIGNYENIHPANKQDVGKRLAGLALARDYGKDLVDSGPLFKDLRQEGKSLWVNFDYTGSGLIAKEGELAGFEIAGEDKVYFPAEARIVGKRVELKAAAVSNPKFARYAWEDNAKASLFNVEGLPASSFSSEE